MEILYFVYKLLVIMKKSIIPKEFPFFDNWPMNKLAYMNNMASIKTERNFTVVTKMIQNVNNGKCYVCQNSFIIKFDESLEKWIYLDSRYLINNFVAHDICREVYFHQDGHI